MGSVLCRRQIRVLYCLASAEKASLHQREAVESLIGYILAALANSVLKIQGKSPLRARHTSTRAGLEALRAAAHLKGVGARESSVFIELDEQVVVIDGR